MDEDKTRWNKTEEQIKDMIPGCWCYVWAVVTNSDLTEGRGHPKVLRDEVYGSEGMARYAGRKRGVMGAPADAKEFMAIKGPNGSMWLLCDDSGRSLTPSRFVEGTDEAHEHWAMETKKRALAKLTPEERSVLGLPKGWRG